jgi:hypothetical protein
MISTGFELFAHGRSVGTAKSFFIRIVDIAGRRLFCRWLRSNW